MSTTVTLEQTEEVPADCRVCHYDELGDAAKARVPELAAEATESTSTVDETTARQLADCDLVKFTDYYAVSAE